MSDSVNHPGYYEKAFEDGNYHPECIEMLDFLTDGYQGVAALDVGQSKYIYRAGSKGDAAMSQEEKTYEDIKKYRWYILDFGKRASAVDGHSVIGANTSNPKFTAQKTDLLPYRFACSSIKHLVARMLVADQFAMDKPESVRDLVRDAILTISDMQTFGDVYRVIGDIDEILDILKPSEQLELDFGEKA